MSFFCGLRTLVFTSLLCFATINSGAEAIEKSVSELTIHPLRQGGDRDSYQWQHKCPMVGPLIPETNEELLKMEILLASPDFLEASALRMSQAVRINTTSVDGMQSLNGNDHAWDHMSAFSRFLEKAFRLVHQKLKLQRINKHGLVYTWQGTDSSLKPVILLAHQDVVPANAEAENWKYPPFEGHWDGTYIWGRGATDCKNTLVASLEAVEELIRAKFIPKRTIILAYGFDEEISGYQGAKNIVKHLLDIYGDKGIAVVIDEGPGIMRSWSGSIAAFPAVAEKGYVDVEISVNMQTGHSSMPPSENSITVMADIVKLLHEHQYSVALDEDNPVSQTIFCAAQNDVNMKDGEWQMVVMADQGSISLNHLAAQITRQHPQVAGFFGTTQSIGMIHGGWKVNVVPGHTKVLINHRVIHGSSIEDVKKHIEKTMRDYASHNSPNDSPIIVNAWDETVIPSNQSITLRALPNSIEPSKGSPFSVDGVTPYGVLQGTTFTQYGANLSFMAPLLMPANTDSRHYWRLSDHIFRFNPSKDIKDPSDDVSGLHGAHRVKERVNMLGHVHAVQWYSLFLRNMDDASIA